MNLLIDLGNTRIKWAFDVAGRLEHQGSAERGDDAFPESVIETWRQGPVPDTIAVASVVTDLYTILLNHALHRVWKTGASYLGVKQDQFGVHVAYRKPELFGVDRWLALVAARRRIVGPVVVVSCGTALTIDVMDGDGNHLGGTINPGLALMQSALLDRAEGVQRGMRLAAEEDDSWLGIDTRGGMALGSLYAAVGAIEHVVTRTQKQLRQTVSVIIAGGDGQRVAAELGFESELVNDLVLRGMQAVVGES